MTAQSRKAVTSIERLAYIIFAILGALVILLMFMGNIDPQSAVFCSVYSGMYSLLPTGDTTPPLPRSCLGESEEVYDTEKIYGTSKYDVASDLVDMVIACYQGNRDYGNNTLPCYKVYLTSLNGTISEAYITDNMVSTGFLCDTVENSIVIDASGREVEYSSVSGKACGKKDMILWSVTGNTLEKGDYVEIRYSGGSVKVIA